MISSTSSRQMKYVAKLQKKGRFREEEQAFVVEGKKLVYEALLYGRARKLYVTEAFLEKHENDRLTLNGTDEKPVFTLADWELVEERVLHGVSDTSAPQGILAVASLPIYSLEHMVDKKQKEGKPPYFILLENLRDPGNLGTIMRTAEGSGADGVILNRESVDLFHPKTVRATMGSIFRTPYFYAEDFLHTLGWLKSLGIRLYAAHLLGTKNYDEQDFREGCGILIGNEAKGLSKEAADLCDAYVKIPMEGRLESLNASAAAAILMYEAYRQRRNSGALQQGGAKETG